MKPIDLDLKDYHEAIHAFRTETDRASAVLAGSFLENYLAKYLRSFMIIDDSLDALFDGFGPFAQFSQRIEAAFAFGWLSATDRRDLKLIARIRNHFAHHPFAASFDSPPISNWVCHLDFQTVTLDNPFLNHTNRDTYLMTVANFIGRWHHSMKLNQQGPARQSAQADAVSQRN